MEGIVMKNKEALDYFASLLKQKVQKCILCGKIGVAHQAEREIPPVLKVIEFLRKNPHISICLKAGKENPFLLEGVSPDEEKEPFKKRDFYLPEASLEQLREVYALYTQTDWLSIEIDLRWPVRIEIRGGRYPYYIGFFSETFNAIFFSTSIPLADPPDVAIGIRKGKIIWMEKKKARELPPELAKELRRIEALMEGGEK